MTKNAGQITKPIIVPSMLAQSAVITLWFHIIKKFTTNNTTATRIKTHPTFLFNLIIKSIYLNLRFMLISKVIVEIFDNKNC
ncbi:MAG: hypothetical protein QHH19_02185 [Candidatus Thermoplasmatota archaeon]|jgi:hypothetical protein|nr:hypothetical protein [Candidatus Thermoplasmatota archaeon]